MNTYVLSLLFLLPAQSAPDIAACLRACLSAPEMEAAFTREWGELRPLYLRKRNAPGISAAPVEEAFGQLTASDFQGLPWEVIPVSREEITQLPAEASRYGILEAGLSFRGERATVNLFLNLPDAPRKWMAASFLLEQQQGKWSVIQKSIEIRP